MKSLHTSLNTAHSGFKPSFSPLPLPPFYRPIPNHPHSYAPDAQATSICHVSPHLPHSVHPEDCTNPYCASYPPATPCTSISHHHPFHPLQTLHICFLHRPGLYIFPFMQYDAPRAVRVGDNSLNLAQAHLALALAASSTPP